MTANRWIIIVVLAGVLGAGGVGWLLRPDLRRRNYEVFPDMAYSPAYGAQAPSPIFADGQTLQAPPAGTIPQGLPPLPYTASPQDAERAGAKLTNPFRPDDAAALARGQAVYATYCQVCHGAEGAGNGPVAQRGFPPPPALSAAHALGLKDGQLFHILTYGQNNMPSYAPLMSRDDRWKAVLAVRALQVKAGLSAPGTQPAGPVP